MSSALLNSRFARRWCTKGLVESGGHHPKWDAQPLLIIYPKPEQTTTPDEILQIMDGRSQGAGGPMKWCSSMQCRTPLPTPRHAISSIRVDYQPMQVSEGGQTAEMQIVIKNKEDKLQRAPAQ